MAATDHVGTGLRSVQAERSSASLLAYQAHTGGAVLRANRCRATLGPDGSEARPHTVTAKLAIE